MNLQTALEDLEQSFAISRKGMLRIKRDFLAEMERGLAGRKSSLKMIPAFVDRPSGDEKGSYLAIDLGGTNFRILEVELKGKRRIGKTSVMKFRLNRNLMTGSPEEFFGFIAGCLKRFLLKRKELDESRDVGFTFSFPVRQTAVNSGSLICWTKDFAVKRVVGNEVVGLLKKALSGKGLYNVDISALANDTVGTLMAKSYEDGSCDMGVILGTGTNACYPEKISAVKKLGAGRLSRESMIINIEWGGFDKLKKTRFDKLLDERSDNRGLQILEKMVSGMYLGRLCGIILKDMASRSLLFVNKNRASIQKIFTGFKTEDMSAIEADKAPGLGATGKLMKRLGLGATTLSERMAVKRVCGIVAGRGARIGASAIAAVITKMDKTISSRHIIAIDGSVFEKHPYYAKNIKKTLTEIFGRGASNLRLTLSKDGSGKGAAIVAAVASNKN